MELSFLSCSSLPPENTVASPTQAALFYAYTPTVTPPIIEFQRLRIGETPLIVRGVINAPDAGLEVRAGPGRDFPVLGQLSNAVAVQVVGKSKGGWLYISYSDPGSDLTGWVVAKYVLIQKHDLNKISFVQIVTPTARPFLP